MDDSFSEKGGTSMMTRMKEWLSMVTLGQGAQLFAHSVVECIR